MADRSWVRPAGCSKNSNNVSRQVQIAETLTKSWESSENCDAILVADGQEFPVHKVILTMHSEFFKAFFRNTSPEPKRRKLNNNDESIDVYKMNQDKNVLKKILQYIYGGDERNEFSSYELSKNVFLAANEYLLYEYAEDTSKILLTMIDFENFADAANLATLFEDNNIINEVFHIACDTGWKNDVQADDRCERCSYNFIDQSKEEKLEPSNISHFKIINFCFHHHRPEHCWIRDLKHPAWNPIYIVKLTKKAVKKIIIRASKYHPNETILIYHQYMVGKECKDFPLDPSWLEDWTLVKREMMQLIIDNNYMKQKDLNKILLSMFKSDQSQT